MGGSETLVVDLANRQCEYGHEVTLLVVNSDVDPALLSTLHKDVRIILLGRHPGSRNPLPLIRLNRRLACERPDILHLHNLGLTGMILPWLRRHCLSTLHTTGIPLEKARGVHLVAISPTVAEDARKRYPGTEITVIPNSIDIAAIRQREDTADYRETLRIVQLGRLFPEVKGQDLLIKALGILRRNTIENVTADFIGSGEGRGTLEALAKEEGVADRVTFLDTLPRHETYSRLASYDLMIHPSRIEGFGLAVIEGMAAGLPVIVPDRGAPFEITDNGRFATTFAYGDAASLAGTIEKCMADYPAAHKRTGSAREYVCKHFSLDAMTQSYLHLYSKI